MSYAFGPIEVSVDDVWDGSRRWNALTVLLNRVPDAVVVALGSDSGRLPLPKADCFSGVATLPGQESTFIDIVLPADRMKVVSTWERAQSAGFADCVVRALSAPDRPLRLTIVDTRETLGVWIEALTSESLWHSGHGGPVLDATLLAPRRPRTATLCKNLYAVITEVDPRMTAMFGWTAQEMLGHRSLEFMHPDDHERAITQWLEVRARRGTQRIRLRHVHRDGSWLWVEVENAFTGATDPSGSVVVTTMTDISDEMAAHEAVRQRERLFHRLAQSLPAGLFLVATDRTIIFANARLGDMLEVTPAATLDEQLATVANSDRPRLDNAFNTVLNDHHDAAAEVEIILPTASLRRRCLFTLAVLSDEEGMRGAIVSVTDVTDSSMVRDDLTFRATFDPLTGCYNRASVLAALDHALEDSAGSAAVIFLDLNHFKSVNDQHGHAVGDQVLIEVTHRLTTLIRSQDVIGRLGGDEFLVVCPNIDDPDQALALAHRIQKELSKPTELAGHALTPAASIGVALSADTCDIEELINRADSAMYESKRLGGTLPVLFSTKLHATPRS